MVPMTIRAAFGSQSALRNGENVIERMCCRCEANLRGGTVFGGASVLSGNFLGGNSDWRVTRDRSPNAD